MAQFDKIPGITEFLVLITTELKVVQCQISVRHRILLAKNSFRLDNFREAEAVF